MADRPASAGARGFAALYAASALTVTLAFKAVIFAVLLRTLGVRLEAPFEERTLVARPTKPYRSRVLGWLGRPAPDGAR